MAMNIFFRVDSSVEMGAGHLMRCLTLADRLRMKGARVFFVCRDLPGNLIRLAEDRGYRVFRLPGASIKCRGGGGPREEYMGWLGVSQEEDARQVSEVMAGEKGADWVVVDHYALDRRWETDIRPYTNKIMVIDDLADRPHDCDLLLDQNLYGDMDTRYRGLVPAGCRMLLGPGNALLRDEFYDASAKPRDRDGTVRRLLVFFGGSDPTDETSKSLEAIRLLARPDIHVDVVAGGSNPARDRIREACSTLRHSAFHCQVNNMADLMMAADLALGAGGTAMWERCFLGLPALVLVVAQNQYGTSLAAAGAGAIRLLGRSADVTAAQIREALEWAVRSPGALRKMTEKSLELMGGPARDREGEAVRCIMGV